MCMFTVKAPQEAVEVAGTHIFGRFGRAGTQLLAYEMSLRGPVETAMLLPLPVAPGTSSIRFIDLAGYPTLFDDLSAALIIWTERHPWRRTLSGGSTPAAPTLPVHQVGAYEASFAPTIADLDRLDQRFRLPQDLWSHLPQYADWGVVAFKLRPDARPQRVHPMAFEFPSRRRDALFFPTVHVHDGRWMPSARFDHALYFQGEDFELPADGWFRDTAALSEEESSYANEAFLSQLQREWWGYGQLKGSRLGRRRGCRYGVEAGGRPVVSPERSAGLLDAGQPVFALGLSGILANADTWLRRGSEAAAQLPPVSTAARRGSRPDPSDALPNLEIV